MDGNYYLTGPSWRGWTLDVALRAFDVTIRTQDGRTCARLPRVYGDAPATVRNPATLLPALGRKTNAWPDSTIRGDFPDKLRTAIDHMDAKPRRTPDRFERLVLGRLGVGRSCRVVGYCMRAWVLRQDSPSNRIILPWWTVRSMTADFNLNWLCRKEKIPGVS